MTSTVIEGHFHVYFNLNLRSYGKLFVLVQHIFKEVQTKIILRQFNVERLLISPSVKTVAEKVSFKTSNLNSQVIKMNHKRWNHK